MSETKSGKERLECNSTGKHPLHNGAICGHCHGLRWIPVPGDALTVREAFTLLNAGVKGIQSRLGQGWIDYDANLSETWDDFRLAPAPQEEPAVKVECESCKGTHWTGDNGPGVKGNTEYQLCDCTPKPSNFDALTKPLTDQIERLGASAMKWHEVARNMSLELHEGKELPDGYLLNAYSLTPSQLDALRRERK